MSSATINFPPLDAMVPFSDQGLVNPDAHLNLLQLYNGFPLQTVDTSAGDANFGVPPAKGNQNVERTYVKISADAHVPTLVASGSDTLNAIGAWAAASLPMGTAQGSFMKLKSDGVSSWYQVG